MPRVLYNQAMLEITAFELAKYLVKTGHTDKASAILNDLIARDPRSVSPRCVRTFAHIAYDCRNWNDAAVLWRIAAGADPNNIEAWIKLATACLRRSKADAEVCASKGRLCERRSRATGGGSTSCSLASICKSASTFSAMLCRRRTTC